MTYNSRDPDSGDRQLLGGISFQHDLSDLGDAVLKTRMIRAFDKATSSYAIHRLVRCSVRRRLEDTFDDLALATGLAAQRLDRGMLLLDGDGVFVHAEGREKSGYCACTFKIWAANRQLADGARENLLQVVGDRQLPEEMFVLDWRFGGHHGHIVSASFEELALENVHDEAYPTLGEPVDELVSRYLRASETVLVLQGAPGTGKTRLVRYLLGAISRRKGASAEVMYTADRRALEHDGIFVEFITGEHDAFVIEDADHLLQSRTSGNQDVHRFLAIADGIVRAQGRKIIFTTNLPNIRDIDEALLRPGRCFKVIHTRSLDGDEVGRLIARLCPRDGDAARRAHQRLPAGTHGATVAEVYRACFADSAGP